MFAQIHKINRMVPAALGLALVLIVIVAKARQPENREVLPDPVEEVASRGIFKSQRLMMGTEFKVTIWAPGKESEFAAQALAQAFDELAEVEKRISSWLPDSETSRVNLAAGKGPVAVGEELNQLLSRSIHWTRKTGGAFDVSGGPLFELWERARERGRLPSKDEVDRSRSLTGSRQLHLNDGRVHLQKTGMKLGFGAIGKGFAADRIAAFLEAKGVSNFLIDAGGDLLAKGSKEDRAWNVAVRHPRGKNFLAGFEAKDCAIASSGDYERYFVAEGRRYSHILDLRTGWPAKHHTGVTVIARSAADADALATALFVMEASQGMELVEELAEVEAILVDDKEHITLSTGLHLEGGRLSIQWK